MGDQTGISWCDRTLNVWIGCTKISEGCKHCYAETMMDHRYGKVQWGPQGERIKVKAMPLSGWNHQYWMECTSCGWRGKMITAPECTQCGLPKLRPTRQRVFVNSLSDLFEDRQEVLPWRNEFFAMSQMYPNLDYLLLTKRPENILRFSPRDWNQFGWPGNIWLGVSVENQARADERIPLLLKVPARIRWLSVEPMLEPVDLRQACTFEGRDYGEEPFQWVVCGGESGPGYRLLPIKEARRLRDKCRDNGVRFYMKQDSGLKPGTQGKIPDDLWRTKEWPI